MTRVSWRGPRLASFALFLALGCPRVQAGPDEGAAVGAAAAGQVELHRLAEGDRDRVVEQLRRIAELLRQEEEDAQRGPMPAENLTEGWAKFTDRWFMLDMMIVLVLSIALSAFVAYHPLTRGKASSIPEIEQPKTFIMYAMVAAVIAQIVKVQPQMALVVFGIGGLLRFRTDVGEAKDTGRVILVTVVGLCCGLKLYVIAVFATLFGWLIIAYLESQMAGRLLVKGLDRANLTSASEAYSGLLHDAGCRILGEKKNPVKGQVAFVFKAPRQLDRESLENRFGELPEEIRGAVDWDIT